METEEFISAYASRLSDQQLAAVTAGEDAVLLLAVPGSGKTTVLVTRIGYLLKVRGIRPENVLTLTYTVAATRDMQRRFEELFGAEDASRLEFRTINGICAKIIQRYAEMVGKPAFSLVTDECDTARILTDALSKNLSDYPTESDVKAARTLITYCKNMMLGAEEIEAVGKRENFPLSPVYAAYNDYLKAHSLMDYDDQMRYALTMLSRSPETLAYWRGEYRHLLVDEAQDTSKIQHEIIKILSGDGGNLFMVGDEDQSIYGFRAAYPEALLAFEKDHPGAKVLVMDRNFRSNPEVVALADRLIAHNRERHEKHMVATRKSASRVNFAAVRNRQAQYGYLLKVAEGCERKTAVLYRDNESALPLIDILERRGIPYRIRNADFSFFTSRVVTDVMNVLRLALDPHDGELFQKTYFKLQAYLKKDQALQMLQTSRIGGMTVWEAAEEIPGINAKTLGRCRAIATNLRLMLSEPPAKALFRLENPMGYGEYLERNGLDAGKLFLLKMLAMQEDTVSGFLMRLEKLWQILREKEYDTDCNFILSTIHSSKGLEYDRVILMDMIDGVFPAFSEDGIISEEERRLFYVGLTRAVNDLTLLCCERERSSFLAEIKPSFGVPKGQGGRRQRPAPAKPDFNYLYSKKELPVKVSVHEGDAVIHKKYGRGTVTGVWEAEDGSAERILVRLQDGEEKLFTPHAFQGAMRVVENTEE